MTDFSSSTPGSSFDIQGISLSTYSISGYAGSTVGVYETNASESGANYVELSSASIVDLSSNTISDIENNGTDQTANFQDVSNAVLTAEAQGLNVMLKPQLEVDDPAYAQYTTSPWINLVDPNIQISDPAAFFAAYKAYMLKWAELAQQDNVAVLSIGNEMVAATKPEYTGYWDDIIAAVRQVYHGELTYSALVPVQTDASTNEVTQIGFWNKLDFAGFDVYPSLATAPDPSVASLNAAWTNETVYGQQQNYVAFLDQLAADVGTKVVFTETGLPSFAGASDRQTSSDGTIDTSNGDGGTEAVTDYQEQANWWQSFFQTWAVNPPAWLEGVFVWNNDPEDLGSYYAQSYNIIGKPAESVIAAWYGGKTYLQPSTDHLNGSVGNDQLYLYGDAVTVAPGSTTHVTAAATQKTTVSITVTAPIVDGTAPTLHAYLNGVDLGQVQIEPADSGYVTAQGVHYTINQTFTFSLPGLQSLSQLEIAFDSPATVDGQSSSVFFHDVSVNGVELDASTYVAAYGGTQAQSISAGTSDEWDAGYSLFDATPWNASLTSSAQPGSAVDPIQVNGGGGEDTLHVLGAPSDYTITETANGEYILSETAGLNQNAILTGIGTIDFQNGSTADLSRLTSSSAVSASTLVSGMTFYDASGNVTEIDTYAVDGSFTKYIIGTASDSWAASEQDYSSSGVLMEKTLFDSSGNVLETDTYQADGSYAAHVSGILGQAYTAYAESFNAQGVETGATFYDATGDVVETDSVNASGTVVKTTPAPVGANYASSQDSYNAAGVLTQHVLLDASGQVLEADRYNLDGSHTATFDQVQGQAYTSYTQSYDANQHLTQETFAGYTNQPFTQMTEGFDQQSRPVSQIYASANGDVVQQSTVTYDNLGGYTVAETASAGSPYTDFKQVFDASGHMTAETFEGYTGSFYAITDQFDAQGRITAQQYTDASDHIVQALQTTYRADGSAVEAYTGITGQSYTAYTQTSDASGHLLSEDFYGYTSGYYAVHDVFDTSGQVTSQLYTTQAGDVTLSVTNTYASDGSFNQDFSGATGQPYSGYMQSYNASGHLSSEAFTGYVGAYATITDQFDANGRVTSQIYANQNGGVVQSLVNTYHSDGSVSEAYSGQWGLSYGAYTQTYDASDHLLTEQVYNNDGSVSSLAYTNGQQLAQVSADQSDDAIGQDETFVLSESGGNVTINGYVPGQDIINISAGLIPNFASLLSHASNDGHGDVLVTYGAHDSFLIADITTAQLQSHASDIHFF